MHGTLTVRSALGEGSTFSLRLPRATGDAPVATVTPEKARLLT
jgi:signal transduction histidine kinase